MTDYRGLLTSRPRGGGGGGSRLPCGDERLTGPGPISPWVHIYLPTLTVFPGVSKFFIKSPALLVIAPNLPKANKAKHKNPNFRAYHSFGPRGGRGGTWVFFGRVCAARDSKLAPRSRKIFPLKLIPRSKNGPIFYTPL